MNGTMQGSYVKGTLRTDRRTKQLLRRLCPGDIAMVHHADLDAAAADSLMRLGAAAVLNTAAMSTGTFPHEGVACLLRSGIPVLEIEEDAAAKLKEGDTVIVGRGLLRSGDCTAAVRPFGWTEWKEAAERASCRFRQTLREFARNTVSHAHSELETAFERCELPLLRFRIHDRPVVVVGRGSGCRDDLAALRPYIQRRSPALIGVDGGADVLAEQGYRPDCILGDMDSVSDETLFGDSQLLVHAYADGRAPGFERLRLLGLHGDKIAVPGTSEDAALRLAYELEAEQIVLVGGHTQTVDFLQKGRSGMASTLLVRMLVGHKLIEARGLASLGVSFRMDIRDRAEGMTWTEWAAAASHSDPAAEADATAVWQGQQSQRV